MNTFCTIVTKSHLSWAYALNESIIEFDAESKLHILVSDLTLDEAVVSIAPNIQIVTLSSLENVTFANDIISKYTTNQDALRWSLKPILISYLLETGYNKVLYCDCDIFFYDNYDFLWLELEKSNFLLTPHWMNPQDPKNLDLLHNVGIYNAGFLGANKNASHILSWFAKSCLFRCDTQPGHIYVDQGYLDFIPVYFDYVKILDHKGCNISYWNSDNLIREVKNGKFYVKHHDITYPIIFYHFASSSYAQFIVGNDKVLNPLFEKFDATLKKFGNQKSLIEKGKLQASTGLNFLLFIWKRLKPKLLLKIPYRIYKIR